MLDTNICIYVINKRSEKVIKKITSKDPETICMSAITWAELVYGVEKSMNPQKNMEALRAFSAPFEIFPWEESAARHAGQIRASLEKAGKKIGPFDTQIAAHALSIGATLVTNNLREFKRIPSLKLENWV